MNKSHGILILFTAVLFATPRNGLVDPWLPVGQPNIGEHITDLTVKDSTVYVVTYSYDHCGVYVRENCLNEQSQWEEITNNIELFPGENFLTIDVTSHPQCSDSMIIYVGTGNGFPGKLWKSQDKGQTWLISYEQQNCHSCHKIEVDPKNWRKIWVAAWPSLIVSEDMGDHWSYVNPPDSQYISSICFDPHDTATVYVSTVGIEPHYGAVFKTIDGGQHWEEKSSGLPESIDWTIMEADPYVSDVLYLIPTFFELPPWGSEFSLYKTTTGGDWWERQVVLLGQIHPVFRYVHILVNPYYPNIIYLGDYFPGRFLQSCSRGSSWSIVIDEAVRGFSVDPADPQKVYIAFEDGIWCYQDPLVGVNDSWNANQLPNDSALFQNYPNPFNTSTRIDYHISTTSAVRVNLKIYNVFGGEVATLVDKLHNSGYYQISWTGQDNDGTEVGSGIYFCRLQIGNHILCKKMILLK